MYVSEGEKWTRRGKIYVCVKGGKVYVGEG